MDSTKQLKYKGKLEQTSTPSLMIFMEKLISIIKVDIEFKFFWSFN